MGAILSRASRSRHRARLVFGAVWLAAILVYIKTQHLLLETAEQTFLAAESVQAHVAERVGGRGRGAPGTPETSSPASADRPVLALEAQSPPAGQEEEPLAALDDGDNTDSSNKEDPCIPFLNRLSRRPKPWSAGRRQFPYVRPPPECRTFRLPQLEALIEHMRGVIADPDLFRLFENSYPNTLDTMVRWHGFASKSRSGSGGGGGGTDSSDKTGEQLPLSADDDDDAEERAYVITGDIDAMWLQDSASQLHSYLPLLEADSSPMSLAGLWRGLINAHARYIVISPYCHAFQPPTESGIAPTRNGAYAQNHPNPPYNPQLVFDCKWELDSLASFLQVSAAYHERTGDAAFFARHGGAWAKAVRAAVRAAGAMRPGTYDPKDGKVLQSAWTFTGWTMRGSETLTNDGLGNPVKENGMVRSAFRPSDDATIFQLLTPSNMMLAAYLERTAVIADKITAKANPAGKGSTKTGKEEEEDLATSMRELARTIRRGIDRDAVVSHRDFGDIFAYEVDGFGSANLMDDAKLPSLLAMPLWGFVATEQQQQQQKQGRKQLQQRDKPKPPGSSSAAEEGEKDEYDRYARVYRNTRRFVLSDANPYFSRGPVLSAVGGPHLGPGKAWPMAAIVAALTAYDGLSGIAEGGDRDAAVAEQLRMVLDSTDGTGVVHESVSAWNEKDWTRPWFGWANGLFGELIIRIARDEERRGVNGTRESLLGRSWQ